MLLQAIETYVALRKLTLPNFIYWRLLEKIEKKKWFIDADKQYNISVPRVYIRFIRDHIQFIKLI